eukprot:TRINITY_DN9508_c0_g6_i1.p1 TRINITY_DN9508_c0_g6~~TRINITY_DN9508_c0_g6_i1.p1  ORF type:complete len:313 (+),score=74.97 TRINITY_DN9508_c0_g6_i1:295-1233(+)
MLNAELHDTQMELLRYRTVLAERESKSAGLSEGSRAEQDGAGQDVQSSMLQSQRLMAAESRSARAEAQLKEAVEQRQEDGTKLRAARGMVEYLDAKLAAMEDTLAAADQRALALEQQLADVCQNTGQATLMLTEAESRIAELEGQLSSKEDVSSSDAVTLARGVRDMAARVQSDLLGSEGLVVSPEDASVLLAVAEARMFELESHQMGLEQALVLLREQMQAAELEHTAHAASLKAELTATKTELEQHRVLRSATARLDSRASDYPRGKAVRTSKRTGKTGSGQQPAQHRREPRLRPSPPQFQDPGGADNRL